MKTLRTCTAVAIVFLIFAGIDIAAVVKIDNTNIGTTNGLWKTPMIHGWEKGTGQQLDSGEWLYPPLYGVLCRLIPDRWVSYGTPAPIVTFRKMALLNSVFGGIASAVLFLLVRQLLSLIPAFIATLAHACAAFVILNSINSEDIIPAYTFFVLMTYFLVACLKHDRVVYLAPAALCCALLTLLHWTLMIPSLSGVTVIALFLMVKNRRRIWVLPVFFAVYLVALELFVIGFGHIGSIWQILYPGKAGPSGYLGLHWTKVRYAFIGIGNYFLGGKNISDYPAAFRDPHVLGWMRISWLFAIVTLAVLVWVCVQRGTPLLVRLLALFGLIVFFSGELEHLYSQPQDPQSQIQPMFASIIGVIVILESAHRIMKGWPGRIIPIVLGALFLWEGGYNTLLMMGELGADSRFMKTANELAQDFPRETTVLVTNGWEEWNAWVFLETFGGDQARYAGRNITLVDGLIDHPGIKPEDAADLMIQRIEDEIAKGARVAANVVWVGSRDDFAYSLTSLTDIGQARVYTDRLYAAFRAQKSWETSAGKFVEIQNAR